MGATSIGCKAEPDDEKGPTVQTFAFGGRTDPGYVGEWHTDPDLSTLDMHKDGSVDIVAVVAGPGGKVTNKLKGQWAVSGSDLLVKYATPQGGVPVVLKYSANVAGDTMKLVQSGNGVKSTYRRKASATVKS